MDWKSQILIKGNFKTFHLTKQNDMNRDLKHFQYERMLEERRGNSFQYPTNEQQIKNDKLGYKHHIFKGGKTDTNALYYAKKIVKEYRNKNNYSRIVCYANDIIGLKTYSVIYRPK